MWVCSDAREVWTWWSACDKDGDGNIGAEVIQQGIDQLLDVKVVDVSHVYGLEVFFDDVDAFGVRLPADGQYWVNVERSKSKTRCSNAVEKAEVYEGQLLCERMYKVFYPNGLL